MNEKIKPSELSVRLKTLQTEIKRMEELEMHEGNTDSEKLQLTNKYRERMELILDGLQTTFPSDIELKIDIDLLQKTYIVISSTSVPSTPLRIEESQLRIPNFIESKEQLISRLQTIPNFKP